MDSEDVVETHNFSKQHFNFGQKNLCLHQLLVTFKWFILSILPSSIFEAAMVGEGTTTFSQMSSKISTETSRYAIQDLDSYQLQTLSNLIKNYALDMTIYDI